MINMGTNLHRLPQGHSFQKMNKYCFVFEIKKKDKKRDENGGNERLRDRQRGGQRGGSSAGSSIKEKDRLKSFRLFLPPE